MRNCIGKPSCVPCSTGGRNHTVRLLICPRRLWRLPNQLSRLQIHPTQGGVKIPRQTVLTAWQMQYDAVRYQRYNLEKLLESSTCDKHVAAWHVTWLDAKADASVSQLLCKHCFKTRRNQDAHCTCRSIVFSLPVKVIRSGIGQSLSKL